jgi:CheY-like chemotaxis protein
MEAIGHLTGGIAHDFNNILAGIIGFSDLGIKRGSQDEKTLGYFFHVSKLAKRARDLVSQMLIYSRGGDPIPKVIDAVNVINDSLKLVLPMLSTDVNVSSNFHDIKPKIKIDPVQLQQILMNFVINSKDAAKGEGCEVKVELSRTNFIPDLCTSCGHKIEGNFIKLEISDNGTGISQENLKKIFEPFFTTKEPGKGTGMGLAMVHGIMHRNHGHIVAKSNLGEGTSFICYFPEVETEVEEKTLTSIKNIPKYSEKKKVLIVDDEQFLRKFVAEFLEVEGYECYEAENGNSAIDILKNNSFDLVITDYTMPGINGIQLIEEIKKTWPHLPVILSSGNIDLELEKNYKHLKIDGMLIKPYDIEDAVAVVNNVVKAVIKLKVA